MNNTERPMGEDANLKQQESVMTNEKMESSLNKLKKDWKRRIEKITKVEITFSTLDDLEFLDFETLVSEITDDDLRHYALEKEPELNAYIAELSLPLYEKDFRAELNRVNKLLSLKPHGFMTIRDSHFERVSVMRVSGGLIYSFYDTGGGDMERLASTQFVPSSSEEHHRMCQELRDNLLEDFADKYYPPKVAELINKKIELGGFGDKKI